MGFGEGTRFMVGAFVVRPRNLRGEKLLGSGSQGLGITSVSSCGKHLLQSPNMSEDSLFAKGVWGLDFQV